MVGPLALILYMLFNLYRKGTFKRPGGRPDYIKNMRFIQMVMGQSSDMVASTYEFIEDCLFWKQPAKAIKMIKDLIKMPLIILIVLFKFKYALVLAMWGGALSSSPFFMSLLTIIQIKVLEFIN